MTAQDTNRLNNLHQYMCIFVRLKISKKSDIIANTAIKPKHIVVCTHLHNLAAQNIRFGSLSNRWLIWLDCTWSILLARFQNRTSILIIRNSHLFLIDEESEFVLSEPKSLNERERKQTVFYSNGNCAEKKVGNFLPFHCSIRKCASKLLINIDCCFNFFESRIHIYITTSSVISNQSSVISEGTYS